jgi:two-component system, OmpR family, response regulator
MPPDSLTADDRPLSPLPGMPTPAQPLAGLTVLVVEDSRFACDGLRILCTRLGARLRRADRLATARAYLRVLRPDVALIDMGLPDGSGIDLIAQMAAGPAPPLILGMSGDDGLRAAALRAGAQGWLDKPVAGLGAFRDLILSRLPERRWLILTSAPGAALPPPDPLALRDDLRRAQAALRAGGHGAYVTGFVTGIARALHDEGLERAAQGPAQGLGPVLDRRLDALEGASVFGAASPA